LAFLYKLKMADGLLISQNVMIQKASGMPIRLQ